MGTLLKYVIYVSAFFATWGEGMQHTFAKASSIFPMCAIIIIIINKFYSKNRIFEGLPNKYRYFLIFMFIHTFLYIMLNTSVLSFGTTETSINPDGFVKGNTSSGDAILKFLIFSIFSCYLSKNLLENVVTIKNYLLIYCIGFASTILIGGYTNEYDNDLIRISGGLSDPNAMAVDALTAFGFSLYLYSKYSFDRRRLCGIFCAVITGISLYAVLMSFSRGGMLSLLCCIILLLCRKYDASRVIIHILIIGICIIVAYHFLIPYEFKQIIEMRFDLTAAIESGGSHREDIWIAYLERWQHYFMIGTGYGNCCSVLENYSIGLTILSRYVTHNQYLSYFVEQGILGLVLYCTYIKSGYKQLLVTKGKELYLFIPFVCYTIATFFVNLSGGRTVWIVFAIVNYLYLLSRVQENNVVR